MKGEKASCDFAARQEDPHSGALIILVPSRWATVTEFRAREKKGARTGLVGCLPLPSSREGDDAHEGRRIGRIEVQIDGFSLVHITKKAGKPSLSHWMGTVSDHGGSPRATRRETRRETRRQGLIIIKHINHIKHRYTPWAGWLEIYLPMLDATIAFDKSIRSHWQAPNSMVITVVIISSINLRRPPHLGDARPYRGASGESPRPLLRLREQLHFLSTR